MTTNRSKYVVHLESATRAPVVPQLATGESQDHGDEQGRVQSATGVGFDFQDRSGGTDLVSTSRLGQSMNFHCSGCGGKPGDGGSIFLGGRVKGDKNIYSRETPAIFGEVGDLPLS
ncbi:unnamed protein product [Sphagnum jensenii]